MLWSEGLYGGQKYGDVVVLNPFVQHIMRRLGRMINPMDRR